MSEPGVIRLAIVEDHAVVAQGVAALLEEEPDIEIVGMAVDLATARALIATSAPDVVLCDVMLGAERDGLRLLSTVRRGRPPDGMEGGTRGSRKADGPDRAVPAFIMFSAFARPEYHAAAIEGGASGYLTKVVSIDQLTRAIRAVAAGGTAFPAGVLRSARTALPRPTGRQREVIVLVAEGRRNEEIARRLSIQVKTVEGQLRRLFDRYGVANRTALVRIAQREGWIPMPDELPGQ